MWQGQKSQTKHNKYCLQFTRLVKISQVTPVTPTTCISQPKLHHMFSLFCSFYPAFHEIRCWQDKITASKYIPYYPQFSRSSPFSLFHGFLRWFCGSRPASLRTDHGQHTAVVDEVARDVNDDQEDEEDANDDANDGTGWQAAFGFPGRGRSAFVIWKRKVVLSVADFRLLTVMSCNCVHVCIG